MKLADFKYFFPVKPSTQIHVGPVIEGMQMPPFWHVSDAHAMVLDVN